MTHKDLSVTASQHKDRQSVHYYRNVPRILSSPASTKINVCNTYLVVSKDMNKILETHNR